jgi:hypothetical protein
MICVPLKAFMAKDTEPIQVRCYHCGRRMEVGARTMSTSCPGCHKTLKVEDIVVKSYTGVVNLETCGRLIVRPKGHAVAKSRIVALAGIEVKGRIHCKRAMSEGQVLLSKKSEWKGDLRAASLVVESGAVILGGHFKVPVDPLEPEPTEVEERPEAGDSPRPWYK